jgi:hypothetical protein
LDLSVVSPLGTEVLFMVVLNVNPSALISALPLDAVAKVLRVEVMLACRVGQWSHRR